MRVVTSCDRLGYVGRLRCENLVCDSITYFQSARCGFVLMPFFSVGLNHHVTQDNRPPVFVKEGHFLGGLKQDVWVKKKGF